MTEQLQAPGTESDAAKSGGGLMSKVKILGLVLVIILVECAVAAMIIPSASQMQEITEAALPGEENLLLEEEAEQLEADPQNSEDYREVALGEFGVTSYQPLSNTTLRIDFQLYGLVKAEDETALQELLEENRHRFRESVLVILRSAEMTDLTDAGLGLIKRKILEKTNRTIGKALLQEVVFSDFSFIEQ